MMENIIYVDRETYDLILEQIGEEPPGLKMSPFVPGGSAFSLPAAAPIIADPFRPGKANILFPGIDVLKPEEKKKSPHEELVEHIKKMQRELFKSMGSSINRD